MVPVEAKDRTASLTSNEWSFVAMGCECKVLIVTGLGDVRSAGNLGPIALGRYAADRVAELDRLWSRFRPDSEISRLNLSEGAEVVVSPETIELVEFLILAWRSTGGAFDPTLLPLLVAGGYARSRRDPGRQTVLPASARAPGRPGGIRVDSDTQTVQLPLGTTLDPGGLGKGLAADLVATELMARGAVGALVDVGGDLRVIGRPPVGDRWRIDLEADGSVVELLDGGVATSSRLTRAHRRAEDHVPATRSLRHDLLNPLAMRDSNHAVTTVSTIAATAAWAEAMTKIPFVLGRTAGLNALERHDVAAAVWTDVDADAGPEITSIWTDYLEIPL